MKKLTEGPSDYHQNAGDEDRRLGGQTSEPAADRSGPESAPQPRRTESRKASPRKSARPEPVPGQTGDGGSQRDIQRSPALGTILLVEDNPHDVFMVGRAFQRVGVANPLLVVRDGEQAIQYLKGEGEYADRAHFPVPQLILLDLTMPRMNGFEVLVWVRKQAYLRHLPVIFLTTSTYSPDVKRAYQLGANSFLTKPTDFSELVSEIKAMADFWLKEAAPNSPSPLTQRTSHPV